MLNEWIIFGISAIVFWVLLCWVFFSLLEKYKKYRQNKNYKQEEDLGRKEIVKPITPVIEEQKPYLPVDDLEDIKKQLLE